MAAVVVFFAWQWLLGRLVGASRDADWYVWLHFILDGGISAFLACCAASLTAPKEHRFVLLGFLLYILYTLFILDFFPLQPAFWPVLGDIIRLSFAAVGAYVAITLTAHRGQARFVKQEAARPGRTVLLTGMALLSIPITYGVVFLSFFVALGVSAWLLLIVLQLPRVPVALIAAIGLAPLVSGWAAVRGLVILLRNPPAPVFALPVDLAQTPALGGLVGEVCRRLGTSSPDRIILHGEPQFFVTQARLRTLDGAACSGRVLAIGAPLLPEMEADELQAVLAHEFAHFTGRDTLYSHAVLPVHRTISSVLQVLQGVGTGSTTGALINLLLLVPRFCILTFVNYFSSIDGLLGRSRELRADRIAAENFGDAPFRAALVKVTGCSRWFYENAERLEPEGDFYRFVHARLRDSATDLERIAAEEQARCEDVFDSHPPLGTRLDRLPRVTPPPADVPPMDRILAELRPVLDGLSRWYNDAFARNREETVG